MRGFVLGSGALIAVYALLNNKGAISGATAGGNAVVVGLQRLLSPKVAAIPQRTSAIPPAASSGGPSIQAPGAPGAVPVPIN